MSTLFHRQILNNSVEYGKSIALTDAESGEQLSFDELRRRSFVLAGFLWDEYRVRQVLNTIKNIFSNLN